MRTFVIRFETRYSRFGRRFLLVIINDQDLDFHFLCKVLYLSSEFLMKNSGLKAAPFRDGLWSK